MTGEKTTDITTPQHEHPGSNKYPRWDVEQQQRRDIENAVKPLSSPSEDKHPRWDIEEQQRRDRRNAVIYPPGYPRKPHKR